MLKSIPAYLYVGGLLGATFLGLSVFLTPRIGSGTLMCLAIAGQILTSMTIDYFGWFGLPVARHLPGPHGRSCPGGRRGCIGAVLLNDS